MGTPARPLLPNSHRRDKEKKRRPDGQECPSYNPRISTNRGRDRSRASPRGREPGTNLPLRAKDPSHSRPHLGRSPVVPPRLMRDRSSPCRMGTLARPPFPTRDAATKKRNAFSPISARRKCPNHQLGRFAITPCRQTEKQGSDERQPKFLPIRKGLDCCQPRLAAV